MSQSPGMNRGQHHGLSGALTGLLTLLHEKAALTYEALDERLAPVIAFVSLRSRLVAEAVWRALLVLASLPAMLYRRVVRAARLLLASLRFIFITAPTWLISEFPARLLHAVRYLADGIRAFLANEVVPTAEFFFEVPPALAGATLRDLFIRTPLWLVLRGPAALADFAKAVLAQLVIILVAMFDRARGLVDQLIEGAIFVWDTLEGGLRWIVLGLVLNLLPWILHFSIEAFDHLVLFLHAAVLFAIAARSWLWRTILGLPDFVVGVLRDTFSVLDALARALVEGLTSLIRALPNIFAGFLHACAETLRFLLIDVPYNLARALWNMALSLLRLVFIDLPTAAANFVASLLEFLWQGIVALARLAVELPGYLWQFLVFVFVTLPREIAKAGLALVQGFVEGAIHAARAMADPLLSILTWALAIAIAPFYLVAKALGLGGAGRQSGRGR